MVPTDPTVSSDSDQTRGGIFRQKRRSPRTPRPLSCREKIPVQKL
ncbi:DNase [Escherichia coli]|nr:DNase [Escherichia coli]